MTSTSFRRRIGLVIIAAIAAQLAWGAEQPRSTKAPANSSARPGTARPGAKGPLPDPVLLDGSNQPAEKKSEYGMIGDFELPGDENARNGRVGGPQNPGQQQQQQGGGMMGLPQGGGGPQGEQAANQSKQGGGQSGAEQQAGQNQKDGKQGGGAGEAGAKAEGTQVAELGGAPSGEQPSGPSGEKPPPVAIGDSAMRIPASQSAAGVVGAQQQVQGNTQHHEKGTGSGGKGPTGVQGNNRVEKGRTIPAGL